MGVVTQSVRAGSSNPPDFQGRYRADALGAIAGERPHEIELLPSPAIRRWPAEARQALEREIQSTWQPSRDPVYGSLHAGLGVWLHYPLVTARIGQRLLIPVLDSSELPIRGELALPASKGPRRIVLLVDASSSANARTVFRLPDGRIEKVSVLEAERRALEHLVGMLEDDWLEFGLIAFGEGTWPIVEPGASTAELRAGLQRFRAERPRGEGRTDLICALWLGREWLEDTPRGVARELYVLTDGDLPHSGRFINCRHSRRRGGREAEARCEERRNRSPCPVSRGFRFTEGRSDLIQLTTFQRHAGRNLRVYPLVFEPDRAARAYQELASETGGQLFRVSSAQAIGAVLPALIARRLDGVFAVNLTTRERSEDLLEPVGERMVFEGRLALRPGPNDIELRVESERGTAALFRFRIHSVPHFLAGFLAELRSRNQALEAKMGSLVQELREPHERGTSRSLEIEPDSEVPASALDE